jgi:hypothetical protein
VFEPEQTTSAMLLPKFFLGKSDDVATEPVCPETPDHLGIRDPYFRIRYYKLSDQFRDSSL